MVKSTVAHKEHPIHVYTNTHTHTFITSFYYFFVISQAHTFPQKNVTNFNFFFLSFAFQANGNVNSICLKCGDKCCATPEENNSGQAFINRRQKTESINTKHLNIIRHVTCNSGLKRIYNEILEPYIILYY